MFSILLSLTLLVSQIDKGQKTPDTEVEDVLKFLLTVPDQDRPFIKFFTFYAVPADKLETDPLTLSFVLHSLVGIPNSSSGVNSGAYFPIAKLEGKIFQPIQQVTKTIYWIDIRDYGWSQKSWEEIVKFDGYFVEPIIRHINNSNLRLNSGNSVLRGDWFVRHASDQTKQEDVDGKNIYDTLLYSLSDQPKNTDEWFKFWGVDLKESRRLGNEYGVVVVQSRAVALRNRMLFGYRTPLGYLYHTYDVKINKVKEIILRLSFE